MPNNEIKIIKIGNKEFDKNEFGNFINNNLEDYLRYAKDKGGFNQDQINMLRDEIYKAYNSNDNFDVTGYSLTNPDNFKNIEVTQNRFLRRDKKIEQGLIGKDSWLAHFIAKAGQTMTPYEKPEDNTKWNYDKHNLNAYFKGINLDAERIFSDYDLRPAETPDATDGKKFKDRAELLYNYLKEYRERYIQDKNYNFTENDYDYDDYYLTDLNNLIDQFEIVSKDEDGPENEDENGNKLKIYNKNHNINANDVATQLEKLGVDPTYIKAFTSNKFEFLTDEEKAALDAKKEEEEKKQESVRLEGVKNQWNNNFWNLKDNNSFEYSYTPFTHYGHENFIDYYTSQPTKSWDNNTFGTYINLNSPENIQGYWEEFLKFLKNPNDSNNNYKNGSYTNQRALLQLMFNSANRDNVFLNLGNNNYLIDRSYTDNGYGAVYNSVSGKVTRIYLGDQEYYNNPAIKSIYDKIRSNWIKKEYGTNDDYFKIFPQNPPPLKEGGLIKKYQEGSKFGQDIDYNVFSNAYDIQNRAKENNISVKEQQEGERYLSEKNKSQANPNAGLTYNDYWSLANAGANIASMLVDPVTGFWVGAASTTSEFINEIARDGFQWKDAGNLIKGYGMDAVGLLPVIGDKLGTLNKTKQILFKFVPGLIGTIGTISSAANTPQIIDSLAKIIDDRPMTLNDWRNVAEGINLVVTGSNFGKGIIKTRQARNATDGSGALQIQVTDDLGNKKLLVVTGEDAAKIRTANKEKGLSGVNEEIHKLKSVEGAENYNAIVDNSKWNNYEWTGFSKENPETGGTDAAFPISRKQEKARIEVYRNPVEYSRAYRRKNPSQATIDNYNKKYIGDTPDKVRAREQEKINKQASRIVRQNEAIKSIESKVQDRLDLEINNKETIEKSIKSYNKSKDRIKKEENELKYWEDYKTNHPNLPGLEKSNTERRNNLEKRKKRHQQKYNDDFETNATKELNKLNKLIEALNKRKQDVEIAKRKDKYDIIRNFPKKEVTIFGKKHTFYPTEIKLPNENPYYISRDNNDISFTQLNKQGGSIDRNKLNKFLNYGKR